MVLHDYLFSLPCLTETNVVETKQHYEKIKLVLENKPGRRKQE